MNVLFGVDRPNPFDEIGRAAVGAYSPGRLIALWALVLLGFCLVVNSSWRATPDAALYLELGESLARGGGYVFNGEKHTYVPPGYPAMVAVAGRVFGTDFLTYRILMALTGLLTAALGYLLVLRICGRDTAILVGGVFALNHELLFNATCTTTDVPFALVTLAGLNAVLSASAGKRRTLWALISGLVIGLSPIVRINGWGIPPATAFFLYCAWTDRSRAARIAGVVVFLCTAFFPAAAWELYKATFPASPNEGTFVNAVAGRSWYLQASIILDAAWGYVSETTSAVSGIAIKTGFLELLLPALIVVGAVAAFTRKERLLVPLAGVQFCGLMLSPAGARYLIFLLPALYLFLGLGLLRVAQALSSRFHKYGHESEDPSPTLPVNGKGELPPVNGGIRGGSFEDDRSGRSKPGIRNVRPYLGNLVFRIRLGDRAARVLEPRKVIIGVFVLLGALNVVHNALTVTQARSALEVSGAETERDLPFFNAARWIRAHSSDGVVMSMHPRVLHYLSGIRSVELIRSGVPESKVWVNATDEIRSLVRANHVTLLFTDNKNRHLYDTVMLAVRDAGFRTNEIPEASSSSRFKLWGLVPGE